MRPQERTQGENGSTLPVILDTNIADFKVGVYLTQAATGMTEGLVEVTGDDLLSGAFTPATATWFAAGITTVGRGGNQDGRINNPCTAVRLRVTNYDATGDGFPLRMVVIQPGIV